jgi:hypothetical protein
MIRIAITFSSFRLFKAFVHMKAFADFYLVYIKTALLGF